VESRHFPHYLAAPGFMEHPSSYLHWGVIQISLANLLVILLMIVVFILAIVIPFPGRRDK